MEEDAGSHPALQAQKSKKLGASMVSFNYPSHHIKIVRYLSPFIRIWGFKDNGEQAIQLY